MNHLHRELAPISAETWEVIDSEAARVLKLHLAARKLVDFRGPLGWTESSIGLGRIEPMPSTPADGVTGGLRRVRPFVELRADFELPRAELDDIARGAKDPDLEPLIEAAKRIARAEDRSVFYGYRPAAIEGICERSPHPPLRVTEQYEEYPATVVEAINALRAAGVDGPFAIALGPRCYPGLMRATGRTGYPILDLVSRLVEGRIVWAPALDGAVVVSLRGQDYQLTVGQDLSIGYAEHDAKRVRLYLMETFTFQVLAAEAAVTLSYSDEKLGRQRA